MTARKTRWKFVLSAFLSLRFWILSAGFLAASLLLLLGALYVLQRKLIYHPTSISSADFNTRALAQFADLSRQGIRGSLLAPFDAIVLEPTDTSSIRATAILFHGNAGDAWNRTFLADVFVRRGIRLILAEYPGYVRRPGAPSQDSIVMDATRLYLAVQAAYPGTPILLVGESLGTGVALQVAGAPVQLRAPLKRLVLLTPFLSLSQTAARLFPWIPGPRYLVKDRFDSVHALTHYRGPISILVAGADEILGADQGRELARIARASSVTTYLEIPGAGHNTWPQKVTSALWDELLGFSETDCGCQIPRAPATPALPSPNESALVP
jgi:uncharacterized protein